MRLSITSALAIRSTLSFTPLDVFLKGHVYLFYGGKVGMERAYTPLYALYVVQVPTSIVMTSASPSSKPIRPRQSHKPHPCLIF